MPITPLYVTNDLIGLAPLNVTGTLTVTPPTNQDVTIIGSTVALSIVPGYTYPLPLTYTSVGSGYWGTSGTPMQPVAFSLNAGNTVQPVVGPATVDGVGGFPASAIANVLMLWCDATGGWIAAKCDSNGHLLVSNNP